MAEACQPKVLIIAEDETVRRFVVAELRRRGFSTMVVHSPEHGRAYAPSDCDLVLIESRAIISFAAWLRELRERSRCELVIFGPSPEAELPAPLDTSIEHWPSLGTERQLTERVARLVRLQRMRSDNLRLQSELEETRAMLETLGMRDPSTGLFGKAFIREALERELADARRWRSPLSLMLVELDPGEDDASRRADTDAQLRQLTKALKSGAAGLRLRPRDVVGRYQDRSLAVLLPGTARAGAAACAERLRRCVQELTGTGTASFGIASYPEEGDEAHLLARAAELALSCAQRSGRNRVLAGSRAEAAGEASSSPLEQVMAQRCDGLLQSLEARAFELFFEPISGPHERIVGYRCLGRARRRELCDSRALYATAEATGRLVELGRVLRSLAIERIEALPSATLLFIDLHPFELTDEALYDDAATYAQLSSRVVLRLSEAAARPERDRLATRARRLRECGYRIANFDLASSYEALDTLALLEPDYIELGVDKLCVDNTRSKAARFAQHLLSFCQEAGIRVVATGVDTASQAAAVRARGIQYLQGALVGSPRPFFESVGAPAAIDEASREAKI